MTKARRRSNQISSSRSSDGALPVTRMARSRLTRTTSSNGVKIRASTGAMLSMRPFFRSTR